MTYDQVKSLSGTSKAIFTIFATLIWLSFITVVTWAIVEETTEKGTENNYDFATISERYLLKEGKENIDGFVSKSVLTEYVSKQKISSDFLLDFSASQLDGVTSSTSIDPTLISKNYLLKRGENNLDGVVSESVIRNYVPKSIVSQSYRLAANGVAVEGVTTPKAIDPNDVTKNYFLKVGEQNLLGVNAPSITISYVKKEDVEQKYVARKGYTQLDGLNADVDVDLDDYIIKNRALLEKQPASTNSAQYAIVPINYESSYTLEVNNPVIYLRTSRTIYLTSFKTPRGSYITHSMNSDERINALRLRVNVPKVYILVIPAVFDTQRKSLGFFRKLDTAIRYEIEAKLNANGTITYQQVNVSNVKVAISLTDNKLTNIKPSDFQTSPVGSELSDIARISPSRFESLVIQLFGKPHVVRKQSV